MSKLSDLRDPADEWIPGAVEYVHWHRLPWTERQAAGVTGLVRIVNSKDAVGFTIQGGDHANWIALVRGPSGTVHAIPGCKVASVTFDVDNVHSDYVAVP